MLDAETSRQPRLAAAERADDVIERPDAAEFEPLAAPRMGKIEGNREVGALGLPGAPVPEPTGLMLSLAALGAAALRRRR